LAWFIGFITVARASEKKQCKSQIKNKLTDAMRQCHRMSEKTAPIAQSRTPTIKDTQKFLAKITRLLNMDNITTTNKK
jgi:hypothetical protein